MDPSDASPDTKIDHENDATVGIQVDFTKLDIDGKSPSQLRIEMVCTAHANDI